MREYKAASNSIEVIPWDISNQFFLHLTSSRLRAELEQLKRRGATVRVLATSQPDTNAGLAVNGSTSGAMMWAPDPSRACARCRAELGRIMNRGAFCKMCRAKVCKNCREYNVRGTEWICNVCHKNL